MTDTALAAVDEILNSLIQKAELAQKISNEITLLNAYTGEIQRRHVEIRPRYSRRDDDVTYPEDFQFWSLLECGRQFRIAELRKQLTELLSPSVPSELTTVPTESEATQQ